MQKVRFLLLTAALMIQPIQGVNGQDLVFDDNGVAREMVLSQKIKSIELYRKGWQQTYPILLLNDMNPLMLEFDELSLDLSNFNYVIYHCNSNWTRSDLMEQEYMSGFWENRIEDAEPSFNTYENYYHYTLAIPNENIGLSRSGNYILVIYRDNDPEDLVFTRRFMVSEDAVTVMGKVNRPILSIYRDMGQEVDITVLHDTYPISDPYGETSLSIYQNGIWDFGLNGLKPLFVNPGELSYDYQQENVFLAGNEYRMFNTRNTQVKERNILDIEFIDRFHYTLNPDEPNPAHLYFDRPDLNGRSFIEARGAYDPDLEADYVWVHFQLKVPFKYDGGDIYIVGECTNWQFTEENRMAYAPELSAYVGSLFLKQGAHNYRYVYVSRDGATVDVSEIEGSHFETRNEYLVLFYHRVPGERYDRLVGHEVVSNQ